jgi:hypothetical protein
MSPSPPPRPQPDRLDDETCERLLSGLPAQTDAPFHALSALLQAAAGPPLPDEIAGMEAAVAAFTATNGPDEEVIDLRSGRRSRRALTVVVGVALALSVSGVASAVGGRLPRSLQGVAHDGLALIGVRVPDSVPAHGGPGTADDPRSGTTVNRGDHGEAACTTASRGSCTTAPGRSTRGKDTTPGPSHPASTAPGQTVPTSALHGRSSPRDTAPGQLRPKDGSSGTPNPHSTAPNPANPQSTAPNPANPQSTAPNPANLQSTAPNPGTSHSTSPNPAKE